MDLHQLWIPSRVLLVGSPSSYPAGLPSDHAKLDQKGLYVTLRAGHVAQGTAGLYVPRPESKHLGSPHNLLQARQTCVHKRPGRHLAASDKNALRKVPRALRKDGGREGPDQKQFSG